MKRFLLFFLCIFVLSGCTPQESVIQGFSMDAPYKISAENISAQQESDIKNYLNEIDSIMNVYHENSLISDFNRTKTLTVSNSGEAILFDMIQKTLPYCNEKFDISIRPISMLWDFKTDNPTVPDEIQLSENLKLVGYQNIKLSENTIQLMNGAAIEDGAVVKGYVCDEIAEMLFDKTALIDIGGTVKTIGKDIVAGVKSPDHNGLLCSFTLSNGKAVATSGSYERNFTLNEKFYHHILNPKTGYPAETDFVSVTVICDSALEADILSTTLFAENSMRIPEGSEVIYVTKDNLVFVSSGIKNFKLLNEEYQVTTLTKE